MTATAPRARQAVGRVIARIAAALAVLGAAAFFETALNRVLEGAQQAP